MKLVRLPLFRSQHEDVCFEVMTDRSLEKFLEIFVYSDNP